MIKYVTLSTEFSSIPVTYTITMVPNEILTAVLSFRGLTWGPLAQLWDLEEQRVSHLC